MVNQDRMAIVIPEVSGYIIPRIGLVFNATFNNISVISVAVT